MTTIRRTGSLDANSTNRLLLHLASVAPRLSAGLQTRRLQDRSQHSTSTFHLRKVMQYHHLTNEDNTGRWPRGPAVRYWALDKLAQNDRGSNPVHDAT